MEARISKYRAEAVELRERAALATQNGCLNDANEYNDLAQARVDLANDLEREMNREIINEIRAEQGLAPLA